MKLLEQWPHALLAVVLLHLSSPTPAFAASWTSRRKLDARNKTRDLWYHGFDNYMRFAFPMDELTPLSCSGKGPDWDDPTNIVYNDVAGNFSLTLVDVLDTLVVLNDVPAFERGVRDTIEYVSFDVNTKPQVFETTIRVMGGLLSAHQFAAKEGQPFHLPWYKGELLSLAKDLGERLLPAFATPTGMPFARLNLRHGVMQGESFETCTAGAGSLILEFGTLSRLTGDDRFEKAAYKAYFALWNRRSDIGLVANTINVVNGKWTHPEVTSIGAGVDSFFEYALKFYVLTGESEFLDVWNEAYPAIMRYARSPNGFTYQSANIHTGDTAYQMTDSLSAFWPGLQVLAGDIPNAIKSHMIFWNIWKGYSGLPEVFDLNHKVATSTQYPLRPELIESTWYLYRATKDPFYLDVGERILYDLILRTKVECGLTGIQDLRTNQRDDRMESFVLSETLKYLYLLFDEDNPINSDDSNYVFTTEGHILHMDSSHIRPMSAIRRKLRGPDNSQCPAYKPWLYAEDFHNSPHGLLAGMHYRPDVDYARMLVGMPETETDAQWWAADGWCEVPPVELYSRDFVLSVTGAAVPEDLSPSSTKVAVVEDGFIVHNISGIRAHIVTRMDGQGYDLTKLGPHSIKPGQLVYFDDPELLQMVANKAGVPAHKTHRRRPELHLHFLPDYVDPMLQLQLATMDVPSDEFITTGSTASFGGDPSAPLADGEEPLLFGHGEGVPVVRDVTNPLGCQPYPYTFQDETVVVHRGDCTFLEKLDHATAAGASGVVVINNDDRGVHPSATDEEVAAVGGHIEDAVLVVVSREAGSSLQHMLDSAERLDGRVWLIVDPEGSEAELGPAAMPTRTKDKATAHVQTLYINGHAVANTRLVW